MKYLKHAVIALSLLSSSNSMADESPNYGLEFLGNNRIVCQEHIYKVSAKLYSKLDEAYQTFRYDQEDVCLSVYKHGRSFK